MNNRRFAVFDARTMEYLGSGNYISVVIPLSEDARWPFLIVLHVPNSEWYAQKHTGSRSHSTGWEELRDPGLYALEELKTKIKEA